jgi:hypothetical protein
MPHFIPVDPERTARLGEVRIGWKGQEDGAFDVVMWYQRLDPERFRDGIWHPAPGPESWTVLVYPFTMFVRYHNADVWLDSLSSPGSTGPPRLVSDGATRFEMEALYCSTSSELRSSVLGKLHSNDTAVPGFSWSRLRRKELIHHYRLLDGGDGYYDILSGPVQIGEVRAGVDAPGLEPVPGMVRDCSLEEWRDWDR